MKTGNTHLGPNREIREQASAWFVDFRVGDVDARSREEFLIWLRRSPEHIQAYLEISATYASLPAPNLTGDDDVHALIERAKSAWNINVVSIDARQAHSAANERARERKRRRVTAGVIAAMFLMMPILTLTWFYMERGIYSTGIGEQRSLVLTDGSNVQLNAQSRIRIRYSNSDRRVDLLEGQALFRVATDKVHPFIVRIGDTQVRAVGTQFDVYRKRRGTVVTVVEGRVAVLSAARQRGGEHVSLTNPSEDAGHGIPPERGGKQTQPVFEATDWPRKKSEEILLAAGEQVTVTSRTVAQPVRANVAAAMAWTEHQLIFDGASLVEVAEEYNRYNTRQLIVDEQGLRDFHVSGTYSSTNADSLLHFLRVQPGIALTETEDSIRVMPK